LINGFLRSLKASLHVTKAHKGHLPLSRLYGYRWLRSKEELGNEVGVNRMFHGFLNRREQGWRILEKGKIQEPPVPEGKADIHFLEII
jgi:hypothetical protein